MMTSNEELKLQIEPKKKLFTNVYETATFSSGEESYDQDPFQDEDDDEEEEGEDQEMEEGTDQEDDQVRFNL